MCHDLSAGLFPEHKRFALWAFLLEARDSPLMRSSLATVRANAVTSWTCQTTPTPGLASSSTHASRRSRITAQSASLISFWHFWLNPFCCGKKQGLCQMLLLLLCTVQSGECDVMRIFKRDHWLHCAPVAKLMRCSPHII